MVHKPWTPPPLYPEPTTEEPTMSDLEDWITDNAEITATDGCVVEPDGMCFHGYPSWMIYMGWI